MRLIKRERMPAVAVFLCSALFVHAQNLESSGQKTAIVPGGKAGYVSDALCAKCHDSVAKSYLHSAHAATSAFPTAESIKGDFTPGRNTMSTSDPAISFLMEKTARGFFQTAIVSTPTETLKRKERIAVVVGSGRKGQTYLYWNRDQLFELPVSSWTETGEWTNSPGYPDGTANFDRGVSDRCLECHTTSFESTAPPRNRFKRESLVLGISCQKCHGPGGEHVAQYSDIAQLGKRNDTAIVNPAKLSRERQMALCSLCHAGVGQSLAPTLSYVAGDLLDKFIAIAPSPDSAHIDPHGSQVQTLIQSRCYQASTTLTCIACHNGHKTQRDLAQFATACLSCHQTESCGKFPALGRGIDGQCVNCHMPLETTAKIVMRINGQRLQPEVRNHRIGIYPVAPSH